MLFSCMESGVGPFPLGTSGAAFPCLLTPPPSENAANRVADYGEREN